jgi:hypothetical protein
MRWPSGRERAAALLRESVQALEQRLSITFFDNRDDLDRFVEFPLRLGSGRLALLMKYDNDPYVGGPTVWIDLNDDVRAALEELSQALELEADAFDWVAPQDLSGTEAS